MPFEKALIVDSDKLTRDFLSSLLKKRRIEVYVADSFEKGSRLLEERHFDLLITDCLELIPPFKAHSHEGICLTTTEQTAEAFRKGAFLCLHRPLAPDTLEAALDKGEEKQRLLHERNFYHRELHPSPLYLAFGQKNRDFLNELEEIAKSDANIFIFGETGTGKEVVAKILHQHSLRNEKPFIKTNCAAIPETLLESEFFGHEKGAFTGALQKRIGRFEMADKGTLLLDEVTEMPLYLQAKLLRAIEEKEFERVGGSNTLRVDVRIFSTSNRNPHQAVADHHLREDLFFRLNVLPVYLPPLRERKEEIIPLAHHFLESFSKGKLRLSPEAEEALTSYNFPGNIRELRNIMERASVLTKGDTILPSLLFPQREKGLTLKELEERYILETFLELRDKEAVAKRLGISLETLNAKLPKQ